MSVAEFDSLAAVFGNHPVGTSLAAVVIPAIVLVIARGFRWVSQTGLSLDDRRYVGRIVLIGWMLFVAVVAALALAVIFHDQTQPAPQPLKGKPVESTTASPRPINASNYETRISPLWYSVVGSSPVTPFSVAMFAKAWAVPARSISTEKIVFDPEA